MQIHSIAISSWLNAELASNAGGLAMSGRLCLAREGLSSDEENPDLITYRVYDAAAAAARQRQATAMAMATATATATAGSALPLARPPCNNVGVAQVRHQAVAVASAAAAGLWVTGKSWQTPSQSSPSVAAWTSKPKAPGGKGTYTSNSQSLQPQASLALQDNGDPVPAQEAHSVARQRSRSARPRSRSFVGTIAPEPGDVPITRLFTAALSIALASAAPGAEGTSLPISIDLLSTCTFGEPNYSALLGAFALLLVFCYWLIAICDIGASGWCNFGHFLHWFWARCTSTREGVALVTAAFHIARAVEIMAKAVGEKAGPALSPVSSDGGHGGEAAVHSGCSKQGFPTFRQATAKFGPTLPLSEHSVPGRSPAPALSAEPSAEEPSAESSVQCRQRPAEHPNPSTFAAMHPPKYPQQKAGWAAMVTAFHRQEEEDKKNKKRVMSQAEWYNLHAGDYGLHMRKKPAARASSSKAEAGPAAHKEDEAADGDRVCPACCTGGCRGVCIHGGNT